MGRRSTPHLVNLTELEIDHILWALKHMENDGIYYGRRDWHEKRHALILAKLLAVFPEPNIGD